MIDYANEKNVPYLPYLNKGKIYNLGLSSTVDLDE